MTCMTAAVALLRACRPLNGSRQHTRAFEIFTCSKRIDGVHSSLISVSPNRNFQSARQTSRLQGQQRDAGSVLPLSERAADVSVPVASLLSWHQQAVAQAQAVGTKHAEADGGPTAEDLLVELNWLLDDTVAAMRILDASEWQPATWRQLEPNHKLQSMPLDLPSTNTASVALRADIATLTEWWKLRIEHRVPLQYVNNCCHWRDLILAVGPDVLIPRPETELLIDFAQQAVQHSAKLAEGPWLDLGTGSGAIAIGLTTILPTNTQVYAIDKSPAAGAWAQLNVQRLKLQGRVQVLMGSWYSPVQHMQGQFAGIVSNPPYIPTHDMQTLQAEVGKHEPWLALDGGHEDGLDALRPICAGAANMLQPGGFLTLETAGDKQAEQVVALLKRPEHAFVDVHIKQDLSGVKRFVVALKRESVTM